MTLKHNRKKWEKSLTHSACRFSLTKTHHPAACGCSSSQRPATRHRWLKFPGSCRRGRWLPWRTPPGTDALQGTHSAIRVRIQGQDAGTGRRDRTQGQEAGTGRTGRREIQEPRHLLLRSRGKLNKTKMTCFTFRWEDGGSGIISARLQRQSREES